MVALVRSMSHHTSYTIPGRSGEEWFRWRWPAGSNIFRQPWEHSAELPRAAHRPASGDSWRHRAPGLSVSHLLASPQSTFRVQMQISVLWALSWVDDTIRIIHFLQEMLFSDFRVETTTQSFNQSILKLEHKPDIINYWVQIGQTESSCHWFLSWISQTNDDSQSLRLWVWWDLVRWGFLMNMCNVKPLGGDICWCRHHTLRLTLHWLTLARRKCSNGCDLCRV